MHTEYRSQNHFQERMPRADSNHRSPVYETGALPTPCYSPMLHREESRGTSIDTFMIKELNE